jgi:hypothetical protein
MAVNKDNCDNTIPIISFIICLFVYILFRLKNRQYIRILIIIDAMHKIMSSYSTLHMPNCNITQFISKQIKYTRQQYITFFTTMIQYPLSNLL